ncbi:FAD-binding oxidoreductase [Cellulomonas marina]|uniref:Ferredoxin-NADP reductase n=1 Tax=Cellulomonas marina TaxID=988821 RepID=A0A1I0W5U9_9CELL|nr:FAD-binding oxidoreductase [Cellulomonas marina]GIG29999.1 oxidoreductase [Cellulomonas marina]SFA83670.1 Ferredoxin-NADP reductase [Cellulomonas marina]
MTDALFAPAAGPSTGPVGGWRHARVLSADHPHPAAVRLRLDVPDRVDHVPGQHYVVRLTADDGYRAQRSYSVASAPSDPAVELWVDRLPDGEVSGFLADEVRAGDTLEVRGPVGGWFVWDGSGPALAVGGGSGVVPLVAMLRHAQDLGVRERLRLAVAARTRTLLPYADELLAAGALVALSREDAAGRAAGRLGADDLRTLVGPGPAFVCGSAGFAGAASRLLVELGVDEGAVRVERFGPTG